MLEDYIYYNRNPNKDIDIDCVVRAISLALNLDYYKVEDMLFNVGYCFECEELEVQCYSYLLERVLDFKVYDAENKTVSQIAEEYPDSTLLIRIEGHLTCAIDGIVYDIWDCTNEIADRYWIIE